jgi:hypothetical protein
MQVNWTENAEKCCALGMEPIAFSSVEQQQCLGQYTSRMNLYVKLFSN